MMWFLDISSNGTVQPISTFNQRDSLKKKEESSAYMQHTKTMSYSSNIRNPSNESRKQTKIKTRRCVVLCKIQKLSTTPKVVMAKRCVKRPKAAMQQKAQKGSWRKRARESCYWGGCICILLKKLKIWIMKSDWSGFGWIWKKLMWAWTRM